MDLNTVLSNLPLLGFILSLLSLIYVYFGPIIDLKEKMGKVTKQLEQVDLISLCIDVATLKTKIELFWDAMGAVAKDIIKQPIHFRKDDLIDRFPNLTRDELCELKDILKDEMRVLTQVKDAKLMAYAWQLANVNYELQNKKETCDPLEEGTE